MMTAEQQDAQMKLKRIFIEAELPTQLEPLKKIAGNIWWTWSQQAIDLFQSIDTERFIALNYNAVALLDQLSLEQTKALVEDKAFLKKLAIVEKTFDTYCAETPTAGQPKIGYFSMEYGLHISLRLYSGGLGVLAGDYLKEASDSNVDMVAMGLLYRYGYFNQAISLHGDQIHQFPTQEFTKLPVWPVRAENGEWLKIEVNIKNRRVFAKVWLLKVGRISLYLLDTDLDENSPEDRSLTHQLYGGDNEHRLKQEILLGIGGVRAMQAMNIQPDVFHCNEGHAAFLSLERLKNYIHQSGLSYHEALEAVRASSLYTTHTPVPAGHDHFNEHLIQQYLTPYIMPMGISWREFMALGRVDADNSSEDFNMSHLAIRTSQEVNGVSKLHGEVSQEMFTKLFPGYNAKELHIGYVTNSVHYPTWIANEWHELYQNIFGKGFLKDQSNTKYWKKIQTVDDAKIMAIRQHLKKRLLDYVREKIQADLTRRGENPRATFEAINRIKDNALVIGFARRFATYKRAHLLFTNRERLRSILNNSDRPLIFLFAGKAHPADGGGQDLIRQIIHISKDPEFAGKIIFLEDYNMEMAKFLVQGVDIWLNTPTRPLEASGTSGMKAALNGVINLSVLDGWWAEGYQKNAGWCLSLERTYEDQNLQNQLDAETIYNILETEIIPTYFETNEDGVQAAWAEYVKNIIAEVAPHFTMKRMLDDYYDRFYNKLHSSIQTSRKNGYAAAKELAAWKLYVTQRWTEVQVIGLNTPDFANHPLPVGDAFEAEISLALGGINPEYIGVEVIFLKRQAEGKLDLRRTVAFDLTRKSKGHASYSIKVIPELTGVFEYGIRIYPKHPYLANRQSLNLVHWA